MYTFRNIEEVRFAIMSVANLHIGNKYMLCYHFQIMFVIITDLENIGIGIGTIFCERIILLPILNKICLR